MNKEMKIALLESQGIDCSALKTEHAGLNESDLNGIIAQVADKQFKGRNLTWALAEANKFTVKSVEWNEKLEAFIVNKLPAFAFTDDEIEELIFKKTTETKRAIWHFVK